MRTLRSIWRRGGIVIFLAVLLALTCFPFASAEGRKEVLVGAVLPLTGKQANPGQFFKKGYELAVRQQNERGGIFVRELGRKLPIRLIIYDDRTDQMTSVSLTERLLTVDKVDVLLGGYSTPLVEAQSVVPEKHGVPYVVGGGASTSIFKPTNRWIFGTMASVRAMAETTIAFLKLMQEKDKLPKPARVAMIWQNTDHGRDYRGGVHTGMKRYPGAFMLVLDEPFEYLAKDHTSIILKVKGVNADVFLSDAHEPDYILQHRAYVEQGLYHKVVSYGARGPERSARQALGDHVDYNIAALWWTPALPYPQSRRFVQDYNRAYHEDIAELYPALAYETARVLLKAIEEAGSLDRGKVRDALIRMDMKGSILPGQRVSFPKATNYQINNLFVLVQNKPGNRVDIIYPEDGATGKAVVPRPKLAR